MKITKKNNTHLLQPRWKLLRFGILIFLMHLSILESARGETQADSLIICVNNIAMNGELTVRGLTANFPYPILSTISVVDSQGNRFPGLADTLRWLGAEDTAENGLLMQDIWSPLKEYHREDPANPPDPDLHHQTRRPLITEIRSTELIPTCTKLVMDVSSSMEQEIEDAKEGARIYIRLFRPVDSGGIVQFAGTVVNVQEMTRDTTVLINNINNIQLYNGTAVYDALMTAINGLKASRGRRSIIIYTDGADNRSHVTPEAVIDSAQAYNLPIYTIALGRDAEKDVLRRIAQKTSALFFSAANAEELKKILGTLSVLMQNYYVMAHGSTDPNFNRTWRVVDVTTNTGERKGRGSGNYFVGNGPKIPVTDLSVTLNSYTDTTTIVAEDTINAILPGHEFRYAIAVRNYGPATTGSAKLVQQLPDSVKFISGSPAPVLSTPDSLVWDISNFMPMMTWNFSVRVQVAENLPGEIENLISTARIFADNDTLETNNFAADTVKVLFSPLPENYNLSIEQKAITDTTVEIEGTSEPAVILGDPYRYLLQIENEGPGTARGIVVWDVLPDSLTPTRFSIEPVRQTPDSLFWLLDSLQVGIAFEIDFTCATKERMPFTPFPLINQSGIIAANDTEPGDNTAATLVYGIKRTEIPNPTEVDISVSQFSKTDSFEISGADTLKYVTSGKTYKYFLKIQNETETLAQNVKIIDILPDFITPDNFLPAPNQTTSDSLVWLLGDLPPGSIFRISFEATVSRNVPVLTSDLVNKVVARADNEKPEFWENNVSQDTVIYINASQDVDISVSQFAKTDSFEMAGADTLKYVTSGKTYNYFLKIKNETETLAQNVKITDILPNFITPGNFLPAPNQTTPDSLVWFLGDLPSRAIIRISFEATVSGTTPATSSHLINTVIGRADNEKPEFRANNVSVDTVIYVNLPPEDWAPFIQARPERVFIDENINITVQATATIVDWDLWVRRADGEIDSTYADDFIPLNPLVQDVWLTVQPPFQVTNMVTDADEEPIIFELRGTDSRGTTKIVQAPVTIQRVSDFYIDRNIFQPDLDNEIEIRFKLATNEVAKLEIYDITGTRITRIGEKQFQSGWNTYYWDGLTEHSQKIGSGFYILTIQSSGYHAWKKLLIVR